MHRFRTVVVTIVVWTVLLALGAVAFAWSGLYDIGADAPHTRPVAALIGLLRERSIQAHAADLALPKLDDPQTILDGAGHYAEMCTGCHLAPGMADSEIRPGLYPRPPNLSKVRIDPRTAFWAIKHGIKMSAMPAWGATHDDDAIWSMVAFVQRLPELTPEQYKDLVAKAPPDEDMEMDHAHEHPHDAGGEHEHPADGPVRPAESEQP
ncbi:MAG: cytochrome c [Rhodanobacteraceae bacterium]|nr:cytochrome c [Rhodanobacteraceae bacterium]